MLTITHVCSECGHAETYVFGSPGQRGGQKKNALKGFGTNRELAKKWGRRNAAKLKKTGEGEGEGEGCSDDLMERTKAFYERHQKIVVYASGKPEEDRAKIIAQMDKTAAQEFGLNLDDIQKALDMPIDLPEEPKYKL